MLQMNSRMVEEVSQLYRQAVPMPVELREIADAGFEKMSDCIFLRKITYRESNVSGQDFPDKTGYECFINSIHIDEHTDGNHLSLALQFAELLMRAWRRSTFSGILNTIISSDEMGAVVKCHVLRQGESWLASDIEKYEESILLLDSRSCCVSMLFKL